MKTNLLFVLFVLLMSFVVKAQISITQSDLPGANDTIRYSIANPLIDYDFSQTGENHTWDLSSLTFQTQGLEEYVSVSQVNFLMGLFFGGSSFAQKVSTDLPFDEVDIDVDEFYIVHTKNSQSYNQEGFFIMFSGLPIPLKYSSKDVIYKLPLNYMDQDSTSFSGSIDLGDTVSFKRQGYRVNEVDGWGTVITPYGEFETIRVKTTLYESDSLYWESLPQQIALNRTIIQYKWLAKNEKFPILEANFLLFEDNDVLVPIGLRYRDFYREPIIIDAPQADFQASNQNPFVDEEIVLLNNSMPSHDINSYQWLIEPDSFVFTQGTNSSSPEPYLIFSEAESYSITLIASNESGEDTLFKENYISVSKNVTSVEDPFIYNENKEIKIISYNNLLTIKWVEAFGTIEVYDLQGKLLLENSNQDLSSSNLDTSIIPSGVYILKLIPDNKNQMSAAIKFIKP